MAFHRPSGTAFQGKGKKLRTMVDYLGQQWSRLTQDGDNAFPAWSPDGEKIV
jgi:Tol biopolymer transport system component